MKAMKCPFKKLNRETSSHGSYINEESVPDMHQTSATTAVLKGPVFPLILVES